MKQEYLDRKTERGFVMINANEARKIANEVVINDMRGILTSIEGAIRKAAENGQYETICHFSAIDSNSMKKIFSVLKDAGFDLQVSYCPTNDDAHVCISFDKEVS